MSAELLIAGALVLGGLFLVGQSLLSDATPAGEKTATLLEDAETTYFVVFNKKRASAEKQNILKNFSALTYLGEGEFPEVAKVKIEGDAKPLAQEMVKRTEIDLVLRTNGVEICH